MSYESLSPALQALYREVYAIALTQTMRWDSSGTRPIYDHAMANKIALDAVTTASSNPHPDLPSLDELAPLLRAFRDGADRDELKAMLEAARPKPLTAQKPRPKWQIGDYVQKIDGSEWGFLEDPARHGSLGYEFVLLCEGRKVHVSAEHLDKYYMRCNPPKSQSIQSKTVTCTPNPHHIMERLDAKVADIVTRGAAKLKAMAPRPSLATSPPSYDCDDEGHGGSPHSSRDNAEHYAKLGDMSKPPCECGGDGVGLHGHHYPRGQGCLLPPAEIGKS